MRMLRASELCEKLGVSRTTLWRLARGRGFPPRRKLSDNVVAWIEEEIDEWINEQEKVESGKHNEGEVLRDKKAKQNSFTPGRQADERTSDR